MSMRGLFALPLLFAVTACHHSPLDSGGTRKIGDIDSGGTANQVIDAPATVASNQSFTVTVTTFGSSCVSAAGADVMVDDLVATITPYDIVRDGTCLEYNKPNPRPVALMFKRAGTATIRVRGASYQGIITVEKSVVVTD